MTRLTLFCLPAVLLCDSVRCDDTAREEFFEKRIRPVLIEHCYQCHSADATNVRGGLLLDSREGVAAGGESGAIIDVKKPADSLLISSLRHESFEMPPDRQLPDHIINDFERWIQDGAFDPRVGGKVLKKQEIDLTRGREFWSFRPINKPTPPETAADDNVNTIDHYVDHRRSLAGFEPPQDATATETVRRLYFTLVGIPPTALEIQEFEKEWQQSPQEAVERVADHLLASPLFGERWGRHWLDVTRFAESSGGGRSLMFPDAWRFRNYVIRSFNQDKPVSQFFREHIAGDLLPAKSDEQFDDQTTGTGYLALGPTNYELQDKQLLEMEVVDEQIDTLGRTFLGLTIGCARCHDHKFDPIPTADYYALAGIFRSTESLTPGNVSGFVTTQLRSGENGMLLKDWQRSVDSLERQVEVLKTASGTGTSVSKFLKVESLPGIIVDDDDAVFEGDWVHSTIVAPFVNKGYRHDDFRKKGCRVRFETKIPTGEYSVRLCHNYQSSRCRRLPIIVRHAGGTTTVVIDESEAPADGVFRELGRFHFNADEPAIVSIDAENSGPGVVIVDAVQFLPVDLANHPVDTTASDDARRQLRIVEKTLLARRRKKPAESKIMSVREAKDPQDDYIRIRGSVRNRGARVSRGFVSVACEFTEEGRPEPARISKGSGRRELAEWITNERNPLTARVYVNRVWLKLIGEGIVRTPDNFGSMGQRPTHPLLLDYLAWTFMHDDKWSTKSLIRRIVTSKTFRMSSSASADAQEQDPENRLLTRGFRRRADAEFIRDALLLIAGQLDLDAPERTIEKITQYDNGYNHRVSGKQYRSVYVPCFRNSMLELFLVFDVANPNLVTGRRNTSTLPAQALFMLNSPEIHGYASAAAKEFRGDSTADQTVAEQVMDAYLMCLGRPPTTVETTAVQRFLNQSADEYEKAWEAVFQALFASVDFRYID